MFKLLTILKCLCVFVSCVKIHHKSPSVGKDTTFFPRISRVQLTPKHVSGLTTELIVKDYEPGEEQIKSISDFPELEEVRMLNIGQESIPNFISLPKLKNLFLSENLIKYIKKEAFSSTPVEVVILYGNQISLIEEESFGSKVANVDLGCNSLRAFSSKWFQNPSALEKIDLSVNYLQHIKPYEFENFLNLYDINLAFNQISIIGMGALAHRTTFNTIRLNNNHLREINPNSFATVFSIEIFTIDSNNLTFLASELLDKMIVKYSFGIEDNPWECTCWETIKNWAPRDTLIIRRDQNKPVCVFKKQFTNQCKTDVDEEIIEHYWRNNDPPRGNKVLWCSIL